MSKRKTVRLNEIYQQDPLAADKLLWDRETSTLNRRGFLKRSGLLSLSAALGMSIPFARNMPAGLIPAAYAADNAPGVIEGKEGLIVLNDRPINAETPAHLLDDEVTPNRYMFIRNNGIPPENINPEIWELRIEGESCITPTTFTIDDLKARFEQVTLQLQLE